MSNLGFDVAVEHQQQLCRRSTTWAIADIHRGFIFAMVAQVRACNVIVFRGPPKRHAVWLAPFLYIRYRSILFRGVAAHQSLFDAHQSGNLWCLSLVMPDSNPPILF